MLPVDRNTADGRKLPLLQSPLFGSDYECTSTVLFDKPHEIWSSGQALFRNLASTLNPCRRTCAFGRIHAYERKVVWGPRSRSGGSRSHSGTELAPSRPSWWHRHFSWSGPTR